MLSVFSCLVSFGQRKDAPYPTLKQLKEKDLQTEITPKANRKGLWGYVNEKDHFVIKAVFDVAEPFRTDRSTGMKTLARVYSGGKIGYLQRDALYLVPPVYDSLSGLDDLVIYFTSDGKKGFLGLDGHVILDGLDELVPFSDRNYAWFCRDGTWGAVGKDGAFRIDPAFTERPELADPKTWRVRTREKQGLLKAADLSVILAAEYDDIVLDRQYDLLYARKDGNYAVFRKNGEKLSDFIFRAPPVFVDNVMKFFHDGKPWLLFSDGRCLSAKDYETDLRRNRSRYLGDSVLPGFLRTRYTEREEGWKDHPWRLPVSHSGSIRFVHSDWALEEDDDRIWSVRTEPLGRVELNKSGEWAESDGSVYGTRLMNLTVGEERQSIGNVLSTLFKTVNSSKITSYDRRHGTDLFHDWQRISFTIYSGIWTGEYRLYALNMFIDCYYQSYFVQRWYVLLDGSGRIVSRWNEDGDVNNPEHPVNRYSFNLLPTEGNGFFVVEDWGETSEFGNRVYKTTLRDSQGKVVGTRTDEFLPYAVAVGTKGYLVFGIGPYGDALEAGNALGADTACWFSKDGNVSPSDIPYFLDGNDREGGFYQYGDSFVAMTVEEGDEVVVGTCAFGPDGLYMPALKYCEAPWGDGSLIAVAMNYFHPDDWAVFVKEPSKELVPGADLGRGSMEAREFSIVTGFPDEAGYYRYSYTRWKTTRYGYLGNGNMTQAVFDEAGPFTDGKAEVVIQGERMTITLKELARYLSR